MKTTLYAVLLLAIMFTSAGCDDLAKQLGYVPDKTAPDKPEIKNTLRSPAHRFALCPGHVDIAFDTQTGQMCRTWDWAPVAPASEPKNGLIRERLPGELTPTCLSIYNQFPTRGDSTNTEGSTADPNGN